MILVEHVWNPLMHEKMEDPRDAYGKTKIKGEVARQVAAKSSPIKLRKRSRKRSRCLRIVQRLF